MKYIVSLTLFFIIGFSGTLPAQTGSISEPVRYIGGEVADPTVHDGKLRLAVGVENRQVLRANRAHPEKSDNYGWTYNHAPNIAYWNSQFYVQYLSNPVDEHIAPSHTLLTTSKDGRNWTIPTVIFPEYKAPPGVAIPQGYNGYMMHQRMCFYVARDGRLLVCGFYGHTEHPFKNGGIGRVVREIYKDGSFGPIYFIRYSSYNTWNESNTSYPFYTKSSDTGFVAACKALLSDKLMTLQWIDEDSGNDNFYPSMKEYKDSVQATSFFHRKDGQVVALWKYSKTALSSDQGTTFSKPVTASTLIMAGGKNWGQRTPDGRYAMVYNPIATQEYRYPLIVVTSDDGIIFDNMLVVHGEVPPRRFYGRWKDFGPNYIRGIVEGNGTPPGNNMWLTYSVNKEDIWVSRVPLSVKYSVKGPINDNFDKLIPNGPVPDWNIYAPQWAPVNVVAFPDENNKSLELSDNDPYDYAKVVRIFQTGTKATLSFGIFLKQNNTGMLRIDVTDRYGNRPVRLWFDNKGALNALDGNREITLQQYKPGRWYRIKLSVNANINGNFDVEIDDKTVLQNAKLAEAVKSVERLSFCTGPYRNYPDRKTPNQQVSPPLEGADETITTASYYIDEVKIDSK
ncbi:MAG: exo-alpha-sialidase [Bacteroidota bacterium]|nr:exo-alpha-sialidase [Bacteroidota bacterium]